MKTLMIIIALLGLQAASMTASPDGDKMRISSARYSPCPECSYLSPDVPLEASFDELSGWFSAGNAAELSPRVPLEAGFDLDHEFNIELNPQQLVPVVPSQADFDETEIISIGEDTRLTPVIPGIASFDETF